MCQVSKFIFICSRLYPFVVAVTVCQSIKDFHLKTRWNYTESIPIHENHFCAWDRQSRDRPCVENTSSTGGPLMHLDEATGQYIAIGLFSDDFGECFDHSAPALFTDTGKFKKFIDSAAPDLCYVQPYFKPVGL